jgi:hypothetical protein
MPRWASRIKLEITRIEIERLQDISADDCRAEGHAQFMATLYQGKSQKCNDDAARDWYMDLWDSINGKHQPDKPDISWKANPFVWSIHFKKLS